MAVKLGPIDVVAKQTGVPRAEIEEGTHGVWVDYGYVFRAATGITEERLDDPCWKKLATMAPED